MMLAKDHTGIVGEDYAAQFLIHRGHHILARNWNGDRGELDLISRDGQDLVAVEVKTRRSLDYGHPVEAIDARKLRRIHHLLAQYRAQEHIRVARLRVDVVGILLSADRRNDSAALSVDYLKDVAS